MRGVHSPCRIDKDTVRDPQVYTELSESDDALEGIAPRSPGHLLPACALADAVR